MLSRLVTIVLSSWARLGTASQPRAPNNAIRPTTMTTAEIQRRHPVRAVSHSTAGVVARATAAASTNGRSTGRIM
jgi:hypothetical protein